MQALQRILLVDDNDADNVYHEIILRKSGFQGDVKIFLTGLGALGYLQVLPDGNVDLILLDINMPGMDGWEFAEKVQPLLASKPTITIVMLTSSESDEDQQRARGLEVIRGYLTKPLDLNTAAALLRRDWQSL